MSRALSLILFLTLSVILPVGASAQGCTQAELAKKPGVLKASTLAGSTTGVMATDLSREKALLMGVHKMLAAAYNPVGVVGDYSFHFSGRGRQSQSNIADTFGYSMYLLMYNCDKAGSNSSAFYIGTDTPTVLRIDANTLNQLQIYASDISDNTFRGYLLMRNRPKSIGGFYFLGDDFSASSRRSNQKEYTWLITYDDNLPFSYLSRKEYLLLTKARLQKTIAENGSNSGFYASYMNRIDDFLKKPDSELNETAIINRGDEEMFTGFLREGEPGSYFAIKHNPAYYRKGLTKSAPQFFTVVYSVWEGDESAVYVDNMNSIKKVVDFSALRNMLGK